MATALVNPFLTLFIVDELGAGPKRLALFLFLTAASAMVVGTILGRLSDRHGAGIRRVGRPTRRVLLLVGAVGACGCYAAFAVLREYWLLLAVSVTLAAVGSTLVPQLFAYARETLSRGADGDATFMISNLRALVSVAWVLGPPLAALLLARIGFTGLFAVVAACYGLVALLAVRLRAAPPDRRTGGQAGGFRADAVIAAAAFVVLQTASALGALALPLFLTRDLHTGVAAVGWTLGLAAALEIPLLPALGALAGRTGPRRLVCTGAGAGVAYYAVVAAAGGVCQVIVAQCLSALFVAGIMGIGISFFQDIMPDRVGSATTLYTNTTKASSMAAGLLIGLGPAAGYRAMFVVSAVLCAAGLALLLVPARTRAAEATAQEARA